MKRFLAAVFALLLACAGARAEPYLAVQSGLLCASCHVSRTGGGMRTAFGNLYAQTQLAANRWPSAAASWDGQLNSYLAAGGNLRSVAQRSEVGGQDQNQSLRLQEARVFFKLSPIPDRLQSYVDHYLRPGSAQNREASVLYSAPDASYYVKAGRLYLPFGWRLQDNSALVRTQSGIDMIGPDRGVELGWEKGPLSLQLSISNGTFGEAEVDSGKHYSLQAIYHQADWRLGAAANFNDRAVGARRALALFAGLRTGSVAWLAEIDWIDDRSASPAQGNKLQSSAWLLEANWKLSQGHNLKIGVEGQDLSHQRGGDLKTRFSAVYEFTPIPFLQLRAGARRLGGPRAISAANGQFYFAELHALF